MTVYLDLDAAIVIATRAIGAEPEIADYGLLESALARPRTTVFGQDAYGSVFVKAGALLHSLTKNRCLVDGNKRLAWLATVVLCYVNDQLVEAPDDDAYDFVIAVADGTLSDVGAIAARIERWCTTRHPSR